MEAPHIPLIIDQNSEEGEIKRLLTFVRTIIWPEATTNIVFKIQHLSMGTSNRVFKCMIEDNTTAVILRVNGEAASLLVDRNDELEMIRRLSDGNEGARLYATFENGYVLEYIPGVILQPGDFANPYYYEQIARKVARLHSIQQPQALRTTGRRGVWLKIYKWLDIADSRLTGQSLREHLAGVVKEAVEYESFLDKQYGSATLVFCHNDLNHANILCDCKDGVSKVAGSVNPKITFLDLEYAGFDYRGFDLGNHFCEWSGLQLDFTRYPTRTQRTNFLRYYLQCTKDTPVTEQELVCLLIECEQFAQVSHLFWHVWSLVLADVPNKAADFDYGSYGAKRWAEYLRRKSELSDVIYSSQ